MALARHVRLASGNALAWFDETLDNSSYGICRGRGVLALRGERWVLQHCDLSVPIPNDLARAFAQRIRAHGDGLSAAPAGLETVVENAPIEAVENDDIVQPCGWCFGLTSSADLPATSTSRVSAIRTPSICAVCSKRSAANRTQKTGWCATPTPWQQTQSARLRSTVACVPMVAYRGKARIPLQVDIGLGDPITPSPIVRDLR